MGGRSGRYARECRDKGLDAFNFKGSILAWTHVNGALVDEGGPTTRVHVGKPKFSLTSEGYEPVW